MKSRMPPPIRNAASEIPKSSRMIPPRRAKTTSTISAYQLASIAVRRFVSRS